MDSREANSFLPCFNWLLFLCYLTLSPVFRLVCPWILSMIVISSWHCCLSYLAHIPGEIEDILLVTSYTCQVFKLRFQPFFFVSGCIIFSQYSFLLCCSPCHHIMEHQLWNVCWLLCFCGIALSTAFWMTYIWIHGMMVFASLALSYIMSTG